MNMLKAMLFVGIGGGAGSTLRYLTSLLVNRYWSAAFPMATFLINLLGCFSIGILAGLAQRQQWANEYLKLLFITGFCGGYTTFSAFALENMNLLQNNNSIIAFLYIASSVLAGLAAVWTGMYIIR